MEPLYCTAMSFANRLVEPMFTALFVAGIIRYGGMKLELRLLTHPCAPKEEDDDDLPDLIESSSSSEDESEDEAPLPQREAVPHETVALSETLARVRPTSDVHDTD